MSGHQHEAWQIRESASGGRYCAACGASVDPKPAYDVYYGGGRDGQRWELDKQVGDVAYIADPGGDLYTRHPDLDTPQDRAWVHLPTLKPTPQGVYVEPQPGQKFLCLQDLRTLVNTAELMGHPDTATIHGVTSWSGRMQRLGLKPAEGGGK